MIGSPRVAECGGWERLWHETDEKITEIDIDGCQFCGGNDCGDAGDVIYLCPQCLVDYKREKEAK